MKRLVERVLARLGAIPKDKYQHFAAGAAIAATAYCVPLWAGLPGWAAGLLSGCAVFAAAIVKERSIDARQDLRDLWATLCGGAVVWAVLLATVLFQA